MKRPTTMQGFLDASSRFATEEGIAKGLAFAPRPTDVFVSPYSKCGTTWMQQIVHGLRTGGDMDFSEITEVVPWIELAHDLGLDPNAPQQGGLRAYKSHLRWDEIPKGGKYIVVFRDPLDAFVSLFRFMEGWFFERGAISVDAFADYYLSLPAPESYWGHAASWWAERDRPEVLAFTFEAMKADLSPVVQQVAAFIGVEDTAAIEIATHQAGFAFMKANGSHFDDHLLRAARDAACGLPEDGEATKVNTGRVGNKGDLISEDLRAAFDRKWQETMGRQFGLDSYAELQAALAA